MPSLDKRIFISKNPAEIDSVRSQFEDLGFGVEAHSFLSFSPVEFELERPYDVIFFGSPRAVLFFMVGQSISEDVAIACVGNKTAELLESLSYDVAFRGKKSGEPKVVAEEFKVWLEGRRTSVLSRQAQDDALSPRVLFPISNRSLKTISGEIAEDQKEEVVVYSTEIVGRQVGVNDVYVFTSPSNVEGFFIDNVISEGAKVIAWGKSTERALVLRGVTVGCTLKSASFEEVLGYLSTP